MTRTVVLLLVVVMLTLTPAVVRADLSATLSALNVEAQADLGDFQVRLSSQFGVPLPEVRSVLKLVASPADAFMCLQLSLLTGYPYHRVVEVYRDSRGAGWGKIAQQLGIKPGSAEFHALKRGDFSLTGGYGQGAVPGKGHSKGHGKGKP